MKNLLSVTLVLIFSFVIKGFGQTTSDQESLLKTTEAIRSGFAKGDVAAVTALHHPDIMKWFGGNNVVNGRAALQKGLTEMFRTVRLEFVESQVESIIFNGETAVETSLFTIKSTSKNGGEPTLSGGRAMVVYVRCKESPTGWVSIREMAQEPPAKK